MPTHVTMMLLHQPRALVLLAFDGSPCRRSREVLVGFWTFRGARPWPPPYPDNENREAAA
jgi:hypothetical protein